MGRGVSGGFGVFEGSDGMVGASLGAADGTPVGRLVPEGVLVAIGCGVAVSETIGVSAGGVVAVGDFVAETEGLGVGLARVVAVGRRVGVVMWCGVVSSPPGRDIDERTTKTGTSATTAVATSTPARRRPPQELANGPRSSRPPPFPRWEAFGAALVPYDGGPSWDH